MVLTLESMATVVGFQWVEFIPEWLYGLKMSPEPPLTVLAVISALESFDVATLSFHNKTSKQRNLQIVLFLNGPC